MSLLQIHQDSSEYNFGVRADCYAAAIRVAIHMANQALSDPDLQVYVAHGVVRVNNREDECYNQRVTHAWCELVDPDMAVVIDAAVVGIHTQVNRRETYYRNAVVNPDLVRRYTVREALQANLACGHLGPWEAPLDVAVDYRRDCELGGGRPSYKLLGDVTGESGLCG